MRKNKEKLKVFVALSGGVDSSVAAFLLKQAIPNNFSKLFGCPTPKGFRGYDVTGVFMRCFNIDGCAERDAEDARRVAEKLQIPFYVWDFEDEYKRRVVDYMVDGYRRGITPNPDVMCNKEIKFGLFLEKALAAGADYMATGHYVRREPEFPVTNSQFSNKNEKTTSLKIENCKLKIARDINKDQSYFLWTLTQEQLKHCLFPIGDYLKPKVREMARRAGLPTAEKKDSQGICFLGKVALGDFLKKYIKPKEGEVVTVSGEKIGKHDGAYFYTIGQRHLGIANRKAQSASSKPFYVAEKDIKTNTVVVAEGSDNHALYKKKIELSDVNFFPPDLPSLIRANGGIRVFARMRYRQPLAYAKLKIENSKLKIPVLARVRYRQPLSGATLLFSNSRELENSRTANLVFDRPQKFVAAGQSAVFYSQGGKMLGGGVIL